MHKRVKKRDKDIRLPAHETRYYRLWKEIKFIDQDPHWYTYLVNEAISTLTTSNGISEAWMPTVRNKRRTALQQTTERTASLQNNKDRVPAITADHHDTNYYDT